MGPIKNITNLNIAISKVDYSKLTIPNRTISEASKWTLFELERANKFSNCGTVVKWIVGKNSRGPILVSEIFDNDGSTFYIPDIPNAFTHLYFLSLSFSFSSTHICWPTLCLSNLPSVTRLGDILDCGQLFKAFGNNLFARIFHILRQFL